MIADRPTCHIEILDGAVVAILKTKTPAECVAMMGDANETARTLLAAGIRYRHPAWSKLEISAEVARRMLGAAD